jgi:hypothetical protein
MCARPGAERPQFQLAAKVPKSGLRFKGEVLHADMGSMTVRDRQNWRVVRTFSYSEKVRGQMQKIIDGGGFQYGDKVDIRYDANHDVALELRGRPAKSGRTLLHAE